MAKGWSDGRSLLRITTPTPGVVVVRVQGTLSSTVAEKIRDLTAEFMHAPHAFFCDYSAVKGLVPAAVNQQADWFAGALPKMSECHLCTSSPLVGLGLDIAKRIAAIEVHVYRTGEPFEAALLAKLSDTS